MAEETDKRRAEFRARIESFWSGEVEWDVPLSLLTTLKIGGTAWAVIRPASVVEAGYAAKGCVEAGLPWVCMGGGSNVLARDEGFPGVVIVLGRKMAGIRKLGLHKDGGQLVEVESGCSMAALLKWCIENSLSGLEFMAGIPGTVGGAVAMNSGAWEKEMKDVIASIYWFDGRTIVKRKIRDLRFAYRCWLVEKPAVVLSVTVLLEEGRPEAIRKTCSEYVAARKTKQPSGASAGSFFKNPEGVAAGRLIQDAGLKGERIGGAVVSDIHANFILNSGGATADDILRLMERVQDKVLAKTGVMLQPEVHILGERGFDP